MVETVTLDQKHLKSVTCSNNAIFPADKFLFALAPQQIGNFLKNAGVHKAELREFYSIPYLANVCLVLVLDKSFQIYTG